MGLSFNHFNAYRNPKNMKCVCILKCYSKTLNALSGVFATTLKKILNTAGS